MSKEKDVEIIIRPDGLYQVTMLFPNEAFQDLLKARGYDRDGLMGHVVSEFAKTFVKANYDALSKLIDMDVVKIKATRALMGAVTNNE